MEACYFPARLHIKRSYTYRPRRSHTRERSSRHIHDYFQASPFSARARALARRALRQMRARVSADFVQQPARARASPSFLPPMTPCRFDRRARRHRPPSPARRHTAAAARRGAREIRGHYAHARPPSRRRAAAAGATMDSAPLMIWRAVRAFRKASALPSLRRENNAISFTREKISTCRARRE